MQLSNQLSGFCANACTNRSVSANLGCYTSSYMEQLHRRCFENSFVYSNDANRLFETNRLFRLESCSERNYGEQERQRKMRLDDRLEELMYSLFSSLSPHSFSSSPSRRQVDTTDIVCTVYTGLIKIDPARLKFRRRILSWARQVPATVASVGTCLNVRSSRCRRHQKWKGFFVLSPRKGSNRHDWVSRVDFFSFGIRKEGKLYMVRAAQGRTRIFLLLLLVFLCSALICSARNHGMIHSEIPSITLTHSLPDTRLRLFRLLLCGLGHSIHAECFLFFFERACVSIGFWKSSAIYICMHARWDWNNVKWMFRQFRFWK